MGAAIAAHVANAGVPVRLYDVASPEGRDSNAVAAAAIARLRTAEPAPLMHGRNAELITPGCVDDDLHLIADCDWIIEAIVERVEIKRALYARLEQPRKPGSIVSSNTSTIRLAALVETLPGSFRPRLSHHPFLQSAALPAPARGRARGRPRARKPSPQSNASPTYSLGKTVVRCKDTPGFIANRIGIYWLQCAVGKAIELGLRVEEADAVMGKPVGMPKTGVFGLLDMTGIDLMPHVIASMAGALASDDPFHEVHVEPPLIKRMIAEGYTGRKGKGGFLSFAAWCHAQDQRKLSTSRPAIPREPRASSQ